MLRTGNRDDLIAPLICQKEPPHRQIHQAGSEPTPNHGVFLAELPEHRRITDVHVLQGPRIEAVVLERVETQCYECLCALVQTSIYFRIGSLAEGILATKEHIPFFLTV